MKKTIISLVLLGIMKLSIAQSTGTITWFGLDFSHARLIGIEGFKDVPQIKKYYFGEWNNVVVAEGDKYNIHKYFKASEVNRDLSASERRNQTVNISNLATNNTYKLDRNNIDKIIQDYNSNETGIGLVFVVESFDKTKEKAFVYVTTFDIASKKIIKCEKTEGSAVGFGFRNYWLGAIANVMKAYSRGN